MLAPRIATTAALSLLAVGLVSLPAQAESAPKRFANCTALNAAHPHGVGRPGAVDKTSGTPVRTFTRNRAVYEANSGSDRDKDGIACEKA